MNTARQHERSIRGVALTAFSALALSVLAAAPAAEAASSGSGAKSSQLIIGGDFKAWLPNFDGMIQLGTETDPGTENRFKNHLNLEPQPEAYDFLVSIGDYRIGKIMFGYLWFEAPGHKVLERDIAYGGEMFLAPETVRSEFTVNMTRLSISYIQSYQGSAMLVYEVGVAQFNWKLDIHNRHTGHLASARSTLNMPLTGLHAILEMSYLRIMAGFTGVLFSTTNSDATATETYLEVDLVLGSFLVIGLGYKNMSIAAELETSGSKTGRLEYNAGGFYAVLGLKF